MDYTKMEQTCKTCGFYENNCPFIRGKLIPYPNKVCKDYTYSVVKAEQEPEVKPDEELKNASEEYCPDDAYPFAPEIFRKELRKAFIAGAEWRRKQMPKWYKVKRGSCFDKHTNFLLSAREGHFYCSAMEVPRDGYILLVDELERLPKEEQK